jgi:hypothetical protein
MLQMVGAPLVRKMRWRRQWRAAWFAVQATGVVVLGCAAQAQLDLSGGQRAADGTAYEVIALPPGPLSAGVESFRVTTVAGSVNGLALCSTGGSGPDQPTSALVGADGTAPQPQVLHAYSAVDRTGILNPNNLTITFDATNAGRLTIGTGAGAIDVCRVGSDCVGGATDAPIVGLASNGGGIPAACVATGATAACAGPRNTFAFGLPASGDPPICASTPTTTTTVCSAVPADGFTIAGGQVVVFIYGGGLSMSGFSNGAAGFGIDTNGTNNSGCAPNTVITADAQAPSAPPPPLPTPTPTSTPTNTPPPTNTPTPIPTQTPTLIPSTTPTMTPTGTLTATPTATPTLTPLPLIRDPAYLCPTRGGLFLYRLHARGLPRAELDMADGLTVALAYQDGVPLAQFHVPLSAIRITPFAARGVKYRFVDNSPGPGIKKWSVRKVWSYGQLQYLINGRAVVPVPRPGRYDIVQQVTLGNQVFQSTQPWQRKEACLRLLDVRLSPQ